MRTPDSIAISTRLAVRISEWGNRILSEDVRCDARYNEDEERLYFKMSRPQYGNYINFTIGEIYDIADVLTSQPELVIVHCVADKDQYGNPIEQITLAVDIEALRPELTTKA